MHVVKRCLAVIVLLVASASPLAASDQRGQVTFGGLPVPGATVTAAQGDTQIVTVTDGQGAYQLANLVDGPARIRVEMLGFAILSEDVTVAPNAPASTWELTLLPFEDVVRLAAAAPQPASPSAATSGPVSNPASAATSNRATPSSAGFQRADVNAAPAAANAGGQAAPAGDAQAPRDETAGDLSQRAADGLLVNGSVNNGAASPFAQLAAFGNNRRGPRSLYNWGVGVQLGNSAWDARPFSFTSAQTPKPDYADAQISGTFGGPLRIPALFTNGPNLFLAFQQTTNHNATTQSARVPTLLERQGNFSQSLDVFGRPVQVIDPATGQPFANGVIPPDRLSLSAKSLLGYYPAPNIDPTGGSNFQTPVLTSTKQDAFQTRLTQTINNRNVLFGNFSYQRVATDGANLFGFVDNSVLSNMDAAANWSHRFSQFLSARFRYQFGRTTTDVTPFFAGRQNVSGDAGITGNNQDSANWGPPSLLFSSGLAGFTGGQAASNRGQTHAWTSELLMSHGRHSFTFGGDVRRQMYDVLSQQDARGSFSFNGASSGSDVADFLLGLPHTSSIAFGNADKFLRAFSFDAYVTDDWRLSPGLTLNLGVRWEYETPFSEQFGRLVNLDVASGFTAVSPVVASSPFGSLTGTRYSDGLLTPDRGGIQPRIGLAWRPIAGSSLVVRGGYGIYRNTNVYQPLALLMAQQPPLSTTLSVESTAANPLTLANGFTTGGGAARNTFAIDPNFRVGYAQNWQVSAQRDLPASLTMIATYLGAKGTNLMQEFLPNTYPAGAVNPCPACPSGFVYLTSNGRSIRHAAQFELRRRLRSGLTAGAQYTFAKAMDDAAAFTGASMSGSAIAQDWLNLDAEWAPSNFDQRHQVTAQFQYTTGVGLGGGALLSGWKGTLVRNWTVTSQMTAGSGLPLTPIFLTSVAGTGVTGTVRGSLTGVPDTPADGSYANAAAFSAPASGEWGNAGRNSIRGPAQFSLNMGVGRTFPLGERLNLDWRIDLVNAFNRVTYASANTVVGSPQFGLPNVANTMRKVQTSMRLRF